jgi:predicted metalloprotease
LLVALLAGACFVGSPAEDQGAGEQRPGPGRSAPSGAVGTQEDGTMTAAEFRQDIADAEGLAERYWQERLSDSGAAFRPIRQVLAYDDEGEVSCGGQPLGLNNAAYCSAGDFIAYDVNWAVLAFRRVGDAFLFYLLGHEYAHGIQVRLGINYRFTIQQELQADCMAGAYIGDMVRGGSLLLQDGDLAELRRGLLAVADDPDQPWFAPGAHGSAEQRTEAFFNGYERSLAACDL